MSDQTQLYRYEDGRSYTDGAYCLPNDDAENDRLGEINRMFTHKARH